MVAKRKTTKSAAKAPARHAKRAAVRLTVDEKQRKVRPGDDLNELVADVLTAWSLVSSKVRVPGVTAAKLKSLLARADRTAKKEAQVKAKLEARLAPLSDARIIANDEVYRAALAVKRVADAVADTQPEVVEAFASVTERFRRAPRQPEATEQPA